jgi:hypothetical protein
VYSPLEKEIYVNGNARHELSIQLLDEIAGSGKDPSADAVTPPDPFALGQRRKRNQPGGDAVPPGRS